MRLALKAINEHLAKLGLEARLEKGDRSFYFSSAEAAEWVNRTVNVSTVSSLTLEQWVDEYKRLKKLNQEILSGGATKKPKAAKNNPTGPETSD